MEINFIGQALDDNPKSGIGYAIIQNLSCNTYSKFTAIVAFISRSGLDNIADNLLTFKARGGEISFFAGVDLHSTSKEALETLLEWEVNTLITYSPNSITYHPKIYIFEGKTHSKVIIGSSNLTASGLFQNIEANVIIEFANEDEEGIKFLTQIWDYYNSIASGNYESTQPLTAHILQILLDAKIVLPESSSRAKINETNKQFGARTRESNTALKSAFLSTKSKRPPYGYRKQEKKENNPKVAKVSYKKNNSNITNSEEIILKSLWIETKAMTGGSRNILDLSKGGRNENKETIFGSVEFFGINSDNKIQSKEITIILNEKRFVGNSLFYTEGNSNWRFQLKGETEEGDKLTTISKPHGGALGGFQKKILQFKKTKEEDVFEMSILEESEIETLKDASSIWGNGGRGGTGRAYGVI